MATAKRPRDTETDGDDDEVDLVALLDHKSKTTVNMKELPEPNKRGKVVYYGYMDGYFCERPPRPQSNVVIDNATLQIIRDFGTEA